MKAWLRQHRFAVADAIARVFRAPASFLFNVLAIAIALSLPIAGLTVIDSIRPVSDRLAVEPEISVFVSVDTPRERAAALAPNIRRILQDSGVSGRLEFIPKENALSALKDKTGMSDALTTLGTNPLPDGYVLRLASFQNAADAVRVDTIAAQLKALPGVEFVQVDSAWVKRLAALMHVLRIVLLLLAVTLSLVVIAVVFNTIRLQVMTQYEEIDVSRLVGATDAFIYRPFYYSGALLGLCAGAFALVIVALGLQPLNTAIADFAQLYASEFRLMPLGATESTVVLAISAALGLSGAMLSVRRQLARSR
jgi:cell division transport system permease protein